MRIINYFRERRREKNRLEPIIAEDELRLKLDNSEVSKTIIEIAETGKMADIDKLNKDFFERREIIASKIFANTTNPGVEYVHSGRKGKIYFASVDSDYTDSLYAYDVTPPMFNHLIPYSYIKNRQKVYLNEALYVFNRELQKLNKAENFLTKNINTGRPLLFVSENQKDSDGRYIPQLTHTTPQAILNSVKKEQAYLVNMWEKFQEYLNGHLYKYYLATRAESIHKSLGEKEFMYSRYPNTTTEYFNLQNELENVVKTYQDLYGPSELLQTWLNEKQESGQKMKKRMKPNTKQRQSHIDR